MLLWRCDFVVVKTSNAWKKNGLTDDNLITAEETLRSGALRWGHGVAVEFSFLVFAGKGNRTGPWNTGMKTLHTAFSSLRLAAPHNLHLFWNGPLESDSSLCCRLHPGRDCSFRLAILTRSTAFQQKENIQLFGGGVRTHVLSFSPSPERPGDRVHLSRLWRGFAESNTSVNETLTWFRRGLWPLFLVREPNNQHIYSTRSQLCLLKTLTSTNLLLIFKSFVSKVCCCCFFLVVLFICFTFWESLKDSVGILKHL